jgi:predicted TIM-barrel fold metal-dependent hydrolase
MSENPLVDTHVHVFTTDMPLIDNPRHTPTYSYTYQDLIATLDKEGVQYAAIAAASPWGDYNDYIVAALRAHPDRLRGTIICKPTIERAVLEAMAKDGVVGVRLPFISMKQLPDITTFEYRSFFRRLADLDWHIHLHTEGENLPFFIPKIEACGVKLVIDHLGRPDTKAGINSEGFKAMLKSIEKGRTWVKTSAAYRLGDAAPDYARALINNADHDKLMWASDCPFVGHENHFSYRSTIDWLMDCIPDRALRDKVFGKNALKLYFAKDG